ATALGARRRRAARGRAGRAGADDRAAAPGVRRRRPGIRVMSEREGSQRERGATMPVRPEGRGPSRGEERALPEAFDAVDVIRTKRDGGRLSDAQVDWV